MAATVTAKRLATTKAKLRDAEADFGAAIVRLLRSDPELRAYLIPKLKATLTKAEDVALLDGLDLPVRPPA